MNNFKLVRTEEVKELNTTAKIYRHIPTGAEILSMENDDENKCFGIAFRTPPSDSTGVAHILEHTVLCGSEKYPVKDPFVQLLKGSLQTFLNAFTYPDKTCYPVASQNLKDFHNLVDVYLDAVFNPRITEDFFMQEGWHYSLENKEDDLTFKGVVYNEMKGVYSSPIPCSWKPHSSHFIPTPPTASIPAEIRKRFPSSPMSSLKISTTPSTIRRMPVSFSTATTRSRNGLSSWKAIWGNTPKANRIPT
ncbi:hypothetical protein EGM51_03620 [Verrucomicrobia bacterium S94]|nr:hypothetical protein EGM51_03620 [Verrucomicrobia bacterium S94]